MPNTIPLSYEGNVNINALAPTALRNGSAWGRTPSFPVVRPNNNGRAVPTPLVGADRVDHARIAPQFPTENLETPSQLGKP